MIGYSAVAVALVLALYGIVAVIIGVRRRRPELIRSAEIVAYVNFGLLLISNLAMVYALVSRDFSVSYVAQVGSHATPVFFTIISLWAALEGSILFWGLVLAGYTAAAVYLTRGRLAGSLVPYATAVMLGVGVFFYLLLIGPANPFGRVWPVPADGPGPNPLLQNHPLMAIHPPLQYLGYVGMTVPFAFAIGALLSGRLDGEWIRATRRWTVAAWAFLTLAIMFGMWWSYEVLGWGGYWAWDPVENAAFLPWLTATAFLHSVMVQERRGMLKLWTLSLIIATFLLTILGTFLTRSGIVASVHAFAQGILGWYFLAFMGVVLVFSLVLIAGRSQELSSKGHFDQVVSRESVFLLNNLLLVAFTFTVLLGTLFPLLAEAVRGVKVSVGAPFFNRMTIPVMAALVFLMGVGPALPWRGATREYLKERFIPPAFALVLVAIVSLILGTRDPYAVMVFAFAAFGLVANVREFTTAAGKRVRAHGEARLEALRRVVLANRRRYGGYLAHIGVLVMAIGIAASSTFKLQYDRTLRPGEVMNAQGYQLRFDELWAEQQPQRFVVGADVTVMKNGRVLRVMDPRMNFYAFSDEPVVTPSVRSRPHEDLYITLMAFERDGSSATFQVFVEPLVIWIWIGGVVIAVGAVVAAWPARRRRGRRDWEDALVFEDDGTAGAEPAREATGGSDS